MSTTPPMTDNDLDFGPTLRGMRAGMKLFAKRYTLVRQLGRGGMGVVWLAQDGRLDREVALKFLPESVQGDPVAVDELKRETKRCLELTHPNIVRIFDFEQEDNAAAIAMEYVDGQTLSGMRLQRPNRVFEVDEILPWLQTAIAALHYAHTEAKMVHRDLKPANFMLDLSGKLKLADFGIACRIGDSFSRLSRGTNAAGAGTLVYMSPQQMMGFPPSVADDIYSIGATLYELLTGRPPFHSGSIERQIEAIVPPSMTDRRAELEVASTAVIPESWELAVAACLEKDAKKRPQSVQALMQQVQGRAAVAAVPPPLPVQPTTAEEETVAAPPPRSAVIQSEGMPGWLRVTVAVACIGLSLAVYQFGYVAPHERKIAMQGSDSITAQALLEAANAKRLLQEKEDELRQEKIAEQEVRDKQMALQAELDRKRREEEDAQRQRMAMEEQRRREEAGKPKVLKVPGDYTTIKEAMSAARPIDTILVASGIYEECFVLKSGVELRGEDRDSTIIRNRSEGRSVLFVADCESGTITNLTFEQKYNETSTNRHVAVNIQGSSITFDNCRVTCLSSDGVWINGAGHTIVSNCQIENCGWDGINLDGNEGQPELRNNHCINNAQDGIDISKGSGVTASANTCNGNHTGLVVRCQNASILNNTCSENKGVGLFVSDGATGLIKGNNCDRNGGNGLAFRSSKTKVEIIDNRAYNNLMPGIIVETICVPSRFEGNVGSGNHNGDIVRNGVWK